VLGSIAAGIALNSTALRAAASAATWTGLRCAYSAARRHALGRRARIGSRAR
jgi:hypothetical protein